MLEEVNWKWKLSTAAEKPEFLAWEEAEQKVLLWAVWLYLPCTKVLLSTAVPAAKHQRGKLGVHPVLSGVHTSQQGSGKACRELWGSAQQNWLLLLCKGLESWMCAVILNARRVPASCKWASCAGWQEWRAACSWVPFSIPQSWVCLEGTQAGAAACYTDQGDWIREFCKREQQPQRQGCCSTWCSWSLFPCRNGKQSSAIYVPAGIGRQSSQGQRVLRDLNPSKMFCSFHLWRKQGQSELTYANKDWI